MGNPLSPIFAEFMMRDLEKHCINNLDFILEHYSRYMDDIFCIIPVNKVQNITDKYKKYHKNSKFTYEKEEENQLNFFYVLVRTVDGSIKTGWYQKTIYSGRVLNFLSNHPVSQKKAIVFNL